MGQNTSSDQVKNNRMSDKGGNQGRRAAPPRAKEPFSAMVREESPTMTR
jgi:hypothetical protein